MILYRCRGTCPRHGASRFDLRASGRLASIGSSATGPGARRGFWNSGKSERLFDGRRLRAAAFQQALTSRQASKSYPAALGHLQRVRDILLQEWRASERDALVSDIRSKHGRKSRFMPGFERLVEGQDLWGPYFLDRARTRWNRSTGEGSMNS